MIYFKCGDYKHGIWGVRFVEDCPYVKLKAPWNEALFSERNGYYIICIPLGFGWRIIVSK